MSEIDDIFASKGKSKEVKPIASPAVPLEKRKTNDKKRKLATESTTTQSKTHATPEVVIDSSAVVAPAKRLKFDKMSKGQEMGTIPTVGKNPKRSEQDRDSREMFPRRRTKEGWLIYKEDELGIRDGGGDTPLCPFDCECCF